MRVRDSGFRLKVGIRLMVGLEFRWGLGFRYSRGDGYVLNPSMCRLYILTVVFDSLIYVQNAV